jgi:N-methylhydantoinase A
MTSDSWYRVATDTGGTFTDFVVLDERANDYQIIKVPSRPDDPSRAVVEGLEALRDRGIRPERIRVFMHGTTVGTNALLEERGARIGLAITEGFRGVYETMEQSRPFGPAVFDLGYTKPTMLAPQSRTVEVAERVMFNGAVRRPLDDERSGRRSGDWNRLRSRRSRCVSCSRS